MKAYIAHTFACLHLSTYHTLSKKNILTIFIDTRKPERVFGNITHTVISFQYLFCCVGDSEDGTKKRFYLLSTKQVFSVISTFKESKELLLFRGQLNIFSFKKVQ